MRICYFLLFIICAFFNTGLFAQQPFNFKFQTYTTSNGLVHNYTKKCQQDSKDFLWIITQHGLSRFDGLSFTNFEHDPSDSNSLPENDLEDIAIDNNDNIWLSYKSGICFYNPRNHRFYTIKKGGLPFKSYKIVYDKKRNCIWSVNFETYASIHCNSLSIKEYDFTRHDLRKVQIFSLSLDDEDRLWIPYGRSGYHTIRLSTQQQNYYPEAVWPTSIYHDRQHNTWMTSWQSGFRKIDVSDTFQQHTLYADPFLRMAQNKYDYITQGVAESGPLSGDSILWVLKNTGGLLLFDKHKKKFVQEFVHDGNDRNGIATDFNEFIFCDRSGIIWMCTWHGITKVNKQEQQFISRELPQLNSQLYNCVTGIADDPYQPGIAWMIANGSGLIKYDKLTNKIINRYFYFYNDRDFRGTDRNNDWRWMIDFIADSNRNIWSCTYGGLVKISNGAVTKFPIVTAAGSFIYPFVVKEFSKGILWLGSGKGLCKFNTATNTYIFYRYDVAMTPSESWVGDLEMLDPDHLLLSNGKGVRIFTISAGTFKELDCNVNSPDSINQFINRSIELIGNKLYIGTFSGLKVYDFTTKKTVYLGREQGIEKIDFHRLQQDANKNLWIFTSNGLFKYDTQKNNFERFTTADGIYDLSEDLINFFYYNSRLYIGYRMAFTSFDPLQVNVNAKKVTPHITEVFVNRQLTGHSLYALADKPFEFAHDKNEITFNYTAPDFTNTDKISFMYRLQGYDTGWITAGVARTVTYNNLRSGNYIFKLKAANSSGLWNNEEAVYRFYIKTAYWRTWWFGTMIGLLICCIIYFIYRYRLKQLKKFYEVRSSISRNLHDEIGATLSSISIYSDVARNKITEPGTRQLVDKMYDASTKAMESMSDIVWYVNPKNDLLENTLVRMREYALPLLEAKEICISFSADEKIEQVKLNMHQRQHLYLIFKEAVNNLLKYAEAKNVSVEVIKEANEIIMKIKDDGKGFDINFFTPGNGLKNMEFRARALNGKLLIDSKIDRGTLVALQFPIT